MEQEQVIWEGLLDNRFDCKVTRANEYRGVLAIYDLEAEKELHRQEVGLAYGAIFGPDVDDVTAWQDLCADFIDNMEKGE